jgi:hypothetical protein
MIYCYKAFLYVLKKCSLIANLTEKKRHSSYQKTASILSLRNKKQASRISLPVFIQ